MLVDFIKEQLIETYIRIERKLYFKNKGILYLLNLLEQDVTRLIQHHHKAMQEIKKKRTMVKQTTLATSFRTDEDSMSRNDPTLNSISINGTDITPILSNKKSMKQNASTPYIDRVQTMKLMDSYEGKRSVPKLRTNSKISDSLLEDQSPFKLPKIDEELVTL